MRGAEIEGMLDEQGKVIEEGNGVIQKILQSWATLLKSFNAIPGLKLNQSIIASSCLKNYFFEIIQIMSPLGQHLEKYIYLTFDFRNCVDLFSAPISLC